MSQGEVLKFILGVFCGGASAMITFSLASAAYLRSRTKMKEKNRLERESRKNGPQYPHHQPAG